MAVTHTRTHTHTHTPTHPPHTHTSARMYRRHTCTHSQARTHTHTDTLVCSYTCTHTLTHTHTYTHSRTRTRRGAQGHTLVFTQIDTKTKHTFSQKDTQTHTDTVSPIHPHTHYSLPIVTHTNATCAVTPREGVHALCMEARRGEHVQCIHNHYCPISHRTVACGVSLLRTLPNSLASGRKLLSERKWVCLRRKSWAK